MPAIFPLTNPVLSRTQAPALLAQLAADPAVRVVLLAQTLIVSGTGYAPEGGFSDGAQAVAAASHPGLQRLAQAALLCNDARLQHQPDTGTWQLHGDHLNPRIDSYGPRAIDCGTGPRMRNANEACRGVRSRLVASQRS